MALAGLPQELFDMIIEYSLPSSIENLATTCKTIYALCAPLIERHNELRSRFRDFRYQYYAHNLSPHKVGQVVAASDLIKLIAIDPTAARYIKSADLVDDSRFFRHVRARDRTFGGPQKPVPSVQEGGDIVQLFANSTYLKRAGLDWRDFYSTFAQDVREDRYSQHGSVFLLTLLEYTEKLTIPGSWRPDAATNQLLNVLVNEARQNSLSSSISALGSVSSFIGHLWEPERGQWGLNFAEPFLALPQLKSFSAPASTATGTHLPSLAFPGLPQFSDTLQVACLHNCCFDDEGITRFLKHTPRLATLIYSHGTPHAFPPPDWNICMFINAVAREAGSHLVELSVTDVGTRGSILPGKVNAQGFQKLQKFEFPLDLVLCNIDGVGVTGNIASSFKILFNGSWNPFVHAMIPPSLTHLMLKSKAFRPHDKALDALFRNFRAVRKTQWIGLQEVHIDCRQECDSAFKQKCNAIVAECKREGVMVHLNAYTGFGYRHRDDI
jgi:hypothetical protein